MICTLMVAALAVQLPSAERVEASLKKPLERAYRLIDKDRPVGTLKLLRLTETADGRTLVLFRSEMEWKLESGDSVRMTVVERADSTSLRLVSSVYSDGMYAWSADVSERRARFTGGGAKDKPVEVADTTVGETSLVGILAAAEQKAGTTHKLDVLTIPLRHYQPGHTLRCVGPDPVEIDGRKVDAVKWEDTWEAASTKDGEARTVPVLRTFWMSPEGYPVRFEGPRGTTAVLAEK